MRTVATQFGISDVAIAKTCHKADIPVPPRGYWAKQQAGRTADQLPLPPRGPGKSDEIVFGGTRWQRSRWPEVDFNRALPPKPSFSDDIDAMRDHVRRRVGKVTVSKTFSNVHGVISGLLQDEEQRLAKQKTSFYVASWEKPRFESPSEQRRLRILNALFLGVERFGCTSTARGRETLDLSVRVGDTEVSLTLKVVESPRTSAKTDAATSRLRRQSLQLAITSWREDSAVHNSWQDDGEGPLESKMTQIVVEMIIAGELLRRESEQRHHRWLVERKEQLEEEARQKKAAQERKERERLARLEAARVRRLLDQATALRQAEEIRAYVDEVRIANGLAEASLVSDELASWSEWALAQANRIDPILNGAFRHIKDDEDHPAD